MVARSMPIFCSRLQCAGKHTTPPNMRYGNDDNDGDDGDVDLAAPAPSVRYGTDEGAAGDVAAALAAVPSGAPWW